MLEIKVTLSAPELAQSLTALAVALSKTNSKMITTSNQPTPQSPLGAQDIAPIQTDAAVIPPPAAFPATATPPTASAATPNVPTTPPTAPAVPVASTTAPPVVPTAAAPTYTHEQIMNAGAALIDAGKMNELMELLNTFSVQAVTQLKQEQLGAFATELRKLGAQI